MDWCETLAVAIVTQAAKDYRKELQKSKRQGRKTGGAFKLEKWFRSEYGQLLTLGKGEYIIEQIQKEVYGGGKR